MMAMESNASWIMASQFHRIWFAKLLLRYAWKIPTAEIYSWGDILIACFIPMKGNMSSLAIWPTLCLPDSQSRLRLWVSKRSLVDKRISPLFVEGIDLSADFDE